MSFRLPDKTNFVRLGGRCDVYRDTGEWDGSYPVYEYSPGYAYIDYEVFSELKETIAFPCGLDMDSLLMRLTADIFNKGNFPDENIKNFVPDEYYFKVIDKPCDKYGHVMEKAFVDMEEQEALKHAKQVEWVYDFWGIYDPNKKERLA